MKYFDFIFTHSFYVIILYRMMAQEELMMKDKYYVLLNDEERSSLIHCLNDLRNNLIKQSKYTDAVDDLLIKVAYTKRKRFNLFKWRLSL